MFDSFENRIDQAYNAIRDKFEIAHDYVPLLSSDERRPIYDPVTVKKYVLYRLFNIKYGNVLDHGILAGWILFDRLQKNHNNAWEVHSSSPRGEIGVYDNFVYENLQWGKKILVRDAYIADVIVAHNIWISSKKTYRAYKKYKLDDLRKANFERHKISSNPLLVLFSIIDTIEPTKFFCAKTGRAPADFSKQVLEDIDLIFNLTERTITITTNGRLPVSDQVYEDWFIKIKSLRSWLCISVKQINDRKMVLTLINT